MIHKSRIPTLTLLIFIMSLGMVGAAFLLARSLAIEPCPICVTQQSVAGILAVVALAALLAHGHLRTWVLLTGLCLPFAMLGAFFSIRHLSIQAMPREQLGPCGISLEDLIDSGAEVSSIVESMITGNLNCGEVVWSFLGISTPGWALIGFVIVFVTALSSIVFHAPSRLSR